MKSKLLTSIIATAILASSCASSRPAPIPSPPLTVTIPQRELLYRTNALPSEGLAGRTTNTDDFPSDTGYFSIGEGKTRYIIINPQYFGLDENGDGDFSPNEVRKAYGFTREEDAIITPNPSTGTITITSPLLAALLPVGARDNPDTAARSTAPYVLAILSFDAPEERTTVYLGRGTLEGKTMQSLGNLTVGRMGMAQLDVPLGTMHIEGTFYGAKETQPSLKVYNGNRTVDTLPLLLLQAQRDQNGTPVIPLRQRGIPGSTTDADLFADTTVYSPILGLKLLTKEEAHAILTPSSSIGAGAIGPGSPTTP